MVRRDEACVRNDSARYSAFLTRINQQSGVSAHVGSRVYEHLFGHFFFLQINREILFNIRRSYWLSITSERCC
ncbi:hypothetical protein Q7C36_019424 [Tachysurus vachellii]|uniref:Uncharacterized protein n=1 Tax=Tachysurus vachellii TaxID=175792 RepID=A0AA88S884_TACVA|nr:hypothetical protein Q7C36_019424 [Tachysurus vachellii]